MSGQRPKTKSIQKTSDLLNQNAQAKAKGKGKEKAVLGSGIQSLAKGQLNPIVLAGDE